MENLQIIDVSITAHAPRLVNVVKERPLSTYVAPNKYVPDLSQQNSVHSKHLQLKA